jgi:hypothetical protein
VNLVPRRAYDERSAGGKRAAPASASYGAQVKDEYDCIQSRITGVFSTASHPSFLVLETSFGHVESHLSCKMNKVPLREI